VFGGIGIRLKFNGRWPSHHAENSEEKRLGNWVSQQSNNKDTMPRARYQQLETCGWWKWRARE